MPTLRSLLTPSAMAWCGKAARRDSTCWKARICGACRSLILSCPLGPALVSLDTRSKCASPWRGSPFCGTTRFSTGACFQALGSLRWRSRLCSRLRTRGKARRVLWECKICQLCCPASFLSTPVLNLRHCSPLAWTEMATSPSRATTTSTVLRTRGKSCRSPTDQRMLKHARPGYLPTQAAVHCVPSATRASRRTISTCIPRYLMPRSISTRPAR
mmetsp:Transcript_13981/g.39481  ORF Transcript_13981/g.39481 Transcript_13981/m.39481 type:complete len:215 (+) Transcript_13981:219-863(+)